MNILIVDDIPMNRRLLQVTLESKGFKIFEAGNGLEAIRILDKEKIDLIISDILMPGMDGYRLSYEIRNSSKFKDLPLILYTATYTTPIDEKLALEMGADKYIIKPVPMEILLQAIHEVIEHRKQHPHTEINPLNELDVMKLYSERLVSKLTERNIQLQKSEEHYRTLAEAAHDDIFISDLNGKFEYINQWGAQRIGIPSQEIIGKNMADIFPPEIAKENIAVFQKVFDSGRSFYVENELQFGGKKIWMGAIITPIRSDSGEIKSVLGIARDITDRKRAEEYKEIQLQRMTALRNIDIAIASSMDLKVTLNIVLDEVMQQLRVDAVDILLMNPQTYTLEYGASRGFLTSAVQQTYLQMGEGSAGKAVLERKLVNLPDMNKEIDDSVRFSLLKDDRFISYCCVPLIAKGKVKGVMEAFYSHPLVSTPEWEDYLNNLAGQAAIAIDSSDLFINLQRSNMDLHLAYDTTIEGWSKALDLRDKETEGHTLRVTEMVLRLARDMGMEEKELIHLRRGSLLHDIGKMGIPDSILLKPDSLTNEEWTIMKKHPVHAYDLLYPIAYLRPALDIPYCHHEKWDGTGYPRGLKGEEIPLSARIFAIIDVWDALCSDRPYRKYWHKVNVIEPVKSGSGIFFDPKGVEAFLNSHNKETTSNKWLIIF